MAQYIVWMRAISSIGNRASHSGRGRVTALLQPKDGEGRERRRPIRVEPLVSNSTLVGRERLVSQWAVMRVYDASGNPKSPIEERGVNFKNANAVAAKHEAEEDWANPMVNKTWQLVEQHGCWWAYEGELPPPEAFTTHRRSGHLPILGPFPTRAMAEARLQRHLSGRGAKQAAMSRPARLRWRHSPSHGGETE
jgi:hypothetical protein